MLNDLIFKSMVEKENEKEKEVFNFHFMIVPFCVFSLKNSERTVFMVMFDEWRKMKNKDGWYYRSIDDLMKDCRISNRSTVANAIGAMVSLGILEKKKVYNLPNLYRFKCENFDNFNENYMNND